MANLRIGYNNIALTANLSASPVLDSQMPVTYLQSSSRGYVARSTSTATQTILGDWGGATQSINMFAINRTNLVNGDTVRLQLYSDAFQTTQIYDSTTLPAFTSGIFDTWAYSFVTQYFTLFSNVKSFKITVVSFTNPAGYIQLGTLYLGTYTEAAFSPKIGVSVGWDDNSTQSRRGGSLNVNVGDQWRTMSFDMFLPTEAEREVWFEIGRFCGRAKTVFISVFPNDASPKRERAYAGFWKFEQSPAEKMSEFNLYDFSLTVNEI